VASLIGCLISSIEGGSLKREIRRYWKTKNVGTGMEWKQFLHLTEMDGLFFQGIILMSIATYIITMGVIRELLFL
jgi:hypothetical protein